MSRIGEAIAIELYVPTITPHITAKAKSRMPGPPNTYITPTARNVVKLVSSVRLMHWLIPALTMSGLTWASLPRTSRMRSNTTIVSFSE